MGFVGNWVGDWQGHWQGNTATNPNALSGTARITLGATGTVTAASAEGVFIRGGATMLYRNPKPLPRPPREEAEALLLLELI